MYTRTVLVPVLKTLYQYRYIRTGTVYTFTGQYGSPFRGVTYLYR